MLEEKYYVKKIDNPIAQSLIVEKHYLHRKTSASYSFGIFDIKDNKLLGCVIFGTPASRFLQKGICGENEADNVIELTRLWISDVVGKNAESWIISKGLKWMKENKVKQDIIVSFSDCGYNHLGTIYQASNFYFTGINHIQKDWVVDGRKEHNRHFIDRFGSVKQAKDFYGDRMVQVERTVKNRYVYFNCNKKRKKELLNKLLYKIQPYPKSINDRIDTIKITK